MKISKYLRKAARLIHANEQLRNEKIPHWDYAASYYDSMLGMCGALADAYGLHNDEAEKRFQQMYRKYLAPFYPRVHGRWHEYWTLKFTEEAQQHRILMLLMAADMAEDDGY